VRTLEKDEALERLAEHTRVLLQGDHGCLLCALCRRRDQAWIVHENASGVVVLDRFGNRYGHLMIVARRHVESATGFDWPEFSELQRLSFEACRVLEQTLQPKRVYVAALGASTPLSTSYPHYHLHVVPIDTDGEDARPARVFSWSSGIVEYAPAEALELTAKLQKAWQELQSG
jgi:diadenosine tetraphosphate (Ap4A) HIT family hydrolase